MLEKTNVRLFCVALPVILEKQIIELKDNLASYTLFFTIIDKATSSIIKNITLIETRAAFNYRLWDQYKVVGRDTFSEIFERKANTIYSRFMLKIVNNKALVRYNTGLQSLNFKPPRR